MSEAYGKLPQQRAWLVCPSCPTCQCGSKMGSTDSHPAVAFWASALVGPQPACVVGRYRVMCEGTMQRRRGWNEDCHAVCTSLSYGKLQVTPHGAVLHQRHLGALSNQGGTSPQRGCAHTSNGGPWLLLGLDSTSCTHEYRRRYPHT